MSALSALKPNAVFKYFEEISKVPRGSLNMKGIADYCVNFALEHSLKYIRDDADNVIIFKDGTKGYENSAPIILQGHIDMVCQKTDGSDFDFLKDSLKLYTDGDYIRAENTTLGADNGIAAAMILSVLESDSISHPPIEAVFTTDEEIGMLGAIALNTDVLKSKCMINMDSEEEDTVTVSCAGGSDFSASLRIERQTVNESEIVINLFGLKGGHSGICINEGRANAAMLAGRLLNTLNNKAEFNIAAIDGGDKPNAIPLSAKIVLTAENAEEIKISAEACLNTVKAEISAREPDFNYSILIGEKRQQNVISKDNKKQIISALTCAPNGVIQMSAEIEGLVETSLNLGVLKTEENNINLTFALRSNKKSALKYLEDRLFNLFGLLSAETKASGHYPPWEYKENSRLCEVYNECYREHFSRDPKIEAIHAGLECGVFADKIKDFDCIAIGPNVYGVHTTEEKLSIASTGEIYKILLKTLEKMR